MSGTAPETRAVGPVPPARTAYCAPGAVAGRDGSGDVFEQHRSTLLSVAYRILASFADAEDVVQEAWLRWDATDRTGVEAPRRFLITVVSRLAIDRVRVVTRRRETYVGPWLPEPVHSSTAVLGPAETAAQRDTLSLATLRLLERLSAPERAVFVLREAFDLPYAEIAGILGLSEAGARQLHRRASMRLAAGRPRYTADLAIHRRLVDRFLAAAGSGDRESLQSLLVQDVTLWSDGGGKVRAALQPVSGADRVARLLGGIFAKHSAPVLRIIEIKRSPRTARRDRRHGVCMVVVWSGRTEADLTTTTRSAQGGRVGHLDGRRPGSTSQVVVGNRDVLPRVPTDRPHATTEV